MSNWTKFEKISQGAAIKLFIQILKHHFFSICFFLFLFKEKAVQTMKNEYFQIQKYKKEFFFFMLTN